MVERKGAVIVRRARDGQIARRPKPKVYEPSSAGEIAALHSSPACGAADGDCALASGAVGVANPKALSGIQ
jgi:hypothetical protein